MHDQSSVFLFHTERLRFRCWSTADLDAGLSIWGDPDVMRFVEPPLDAETVLRSIEAGRRHFERHRCQHWAMVPHTSDTPVGACGFNVFEEESPGGEFCEGGPRLEMVFHLSKTVWGQGLATEAALGALKYAETHLRPAGFVAGVHPGNSASARVLEKVGFVAGGMRHFQDTDETLLWFTRLRGPLSGGA
ncbi:MAG: GNAT family N-acetyltransferase [Bradymonadia bacterium]